MRKLACLVVTLAASGGLGAVAASSASATTMPPPCPTHPVVYYSNGNYVIQYGCFAPITIPGSISTPPPPGV